VGQVNATQNDKIFECDFFVLKHLNLEQVCLLFNLYRIIKIKHEVIFF